MSPQGNPPFRRRVGECSESDLGCPPVETWYLEWDVNTQPFPDLADSWLFTAGGSGGPLRCKGFGPRRCRVFLPGNGDWMWGVSTVWGLVGESTFVYGTRWECLP